MSIIKKTISGSGRKNNSVVPPQGQGPKYKTYVNWRQEIFEDCIASDVSWIRLRSPVTNTESIELYTNGILNRYGVDYTISGRIITFTENIPEGWNIIVSYDAESGEYDQTGPRCGLV